MEVMKMELTKVHVSWWKGYVFGWISTDIKLDKKDLYWNRLEGSAFDDNCVDRIFCEHMIEHLTDDKGIKISKEFRRVLKKNGVVLTSTLELSNILSTVMVPEFIKRMAEKYLSQR